MVLKAIDPKSCNHKITEAGIKAEKQMAFYLNRSFGESDDIHVINDLRLDYKGEIAQFDHLILHRFGFIVVESKSVSSKISVNKHGEWARHYKGKKGMKSPVNQARMQMDILMKLFKHSSDFVIKSRLRTKIPLNELKYDVFVAISDGGIIERDIDIPEVKKADQICDAVEKSIKDYVKHNKAFTTINYLYELRLENLTKVSEFLLDHHRPAKTAITQNKPTEVQEERSIYSTPEESNSHLLDAYQGVCRHCQSQNISVFNSYGYKVKCGDCEESEPLQLSCPSCSSEGMKLKKQSQEFKILCPHCEFTAGYIVSPEQLTSMPSNNLDVSNNATDCPKCGEDLVERTATKGANAGNKFLGCSAYPKCRYTVFS